MKVIGFCGKKGSGKGVAASHLVTAADYQLLKFATPLKDMMRSLGLSEDHIEGALKELPTPLLGGNSPRHGMQTLGTEWGRYCMGENFWVNHWSRIALQVLDFNGRVTVDDVRFENEANALHELGGKLIEIQRPGLVCEDVHVSEQMHGIHPDMVLINDGSVEDLCRKIDAVLAA